jgi:hypothetical protein
LGTEKKNFSNFGKPEEENIIPDWDFMRDIDTIEISRIKKWIHIKSGVKLKLSFNIINELTPG